MTLTKSTTRQPAGLFALSLRQTLPRSQATWPLQGAGTVSRTFAKGAGSRPLALSSPTARLTGTQDSHG